MLAGASILTSCQTPNCDLTGNRFTADDVIFATDSDAYLYDHCQFTGSTQKTRDDEARVIREKLNKLAAELARGGYTEIMLSVHGGLNRESAGIDSARKKFHALNANSEPLTKILPIFLTWDSGLLSSYQSHLLFEDGGISYRNHKVVKALNVLKGIFIDLPTDLATGVATTTRSLTNGMTKSIQNWDDLYRIRPSLFPIRHALDSTLKDEFCLNSDPVKGLYCTAGAHKSFHVSMGPSKSSHKMEGAINIAFSPAKAAFAPFYEALGTPGWHNMTRRSQTLVYRAPTLQMNSSGSDGAADGVLAVLLKEISQWQKRYPHIKLTVAGHSMGTMVLNSGFRAVLSQDIPPIQVDRIIYLAAACRIRDFKDTTGHYLREHPKTEFYNLCLNPYREIGESNPKQAPLFLSGSLLVWIDEFFEKPHDFLDRTLGTFENAIIAHKHLPQGARFTLKAFGEQGANKEHKGKDLGPQNHGDFGKYRFWESKFLEPEKSGAPVCYQCLKIP